MLGTGKTVGDVRRSNISLLLKLLYYEGPQSRKKLARKSQLTSAAVTLLINELQERGFIINSDKVAVRKRAGRLEQYVDLNYAGLFIAGVRIRRDVLELRIFNLRLECIAQMDLDPGMLANVDGFFEYVCDKISFLMFQNDISAKSLLGVGVSITGFVDPVNGVTLNSYGTLPNGVNIRDQLESRMNVPVLVNNNVRSILMAESAISHRSQGISHLLVNYGPGVGGAFSVGQAPYYGSGNRAMELGHILLDPNGEPCACGKRGCLETVVSYPTILRQAAELADPGKTPMLQGEVERGALTLDGLARAAEAGEAPVVGLVCEKFDILAKCLEDFTTILDPGSVSIIGRIFNHEPLDKLFQASIKAHAPLLEDRLSINYDARRMEQVSPASLVIHAFLMGQLLNGSNSGSGAAEVAFV